MHQRVHRQAMVVSFLKGEGENTQTGGFSLVCAGRVSGDQVSIDTMYDCRASCEGGTRHGLDLEPHDTAIASDRPRGADCNRFAPISR